MKINFLKLSRIFFYLFFAVLPFQINALVWTPAVGISGFFNPYLSHFLYLGDVFLVLTLLFLGISIFFGNRDRIFSKKLNLPLFMGGLLVLGGYLVSVTGAFDQMNSLFYGLRILEFVVVAFLIGSDFVNLKRLLYIFVGIMSFTAFIGIFQYIFQQSLGLSFLGEPVVSADMLGTAKISLFGENTLRAYGTFPHPNIFAGYLVFAIFLIIYLLRGLKGERRLLFSLLLVVCLLALVFTFSRSAFLALFAGLLLYYAVSNVRISWKHIVLILVLGMFFVVVFDLFSVLGGRLLIGDTAGFAERTLYLSISKSMFLENIFGVGAGNFTGVMQSYSEVSLMPWLFQPAHNMFLLVLNELGIVGGGLFYGFFVYLFVNLVGRGDGARNKRFTGILMALWAVILVIGLFDHYFISLYQGQALLWMFVGMNGRL